MMNQHAPRLTRALRWVLPALLAAWCWAPVQAQVPRQVNYQGYLTDAGGTPVNATLQMAFKLYDVASGGAALYSETQTVTVTAGVFNALIGTEMPLALPFDEPYWLGLTVGADPEMAPRQPLAASPYALHAATAETLAGGNLTLANPSTAGAGNITKGANRFIHNFGSGNTFVGENAGNFSLSGGANTGSGANALGANTNGEWNTANGFAALLYNQGGSYNTAIGMETLVLNIGGISNTALGTRALTSSLGSNNIGIGAFSGVNLTTGSDNIAIGNAGGAGESGTLRIGSASQTRTFIAGIRGVTPGVADGLPVIIDSSGQLGTGSGGGVTGGAIGEVLAGTGAAPAWTGSPALSGNLTLANPSTAAAGVIMKGTSSFIHNFGASNTFVGELVGNFTMGGTLNSAFGANALQYNTFGFDNTAAGKQAMQNNLSGYRSTAVGAYALLLHTHGSENTAVGHSALASVATVCCNTGVGVNALLSATGAGNTALGRGAGALLTTGSNNIMIGNAGVAGESATMRLGDANQTRAFIAGVRGVTPGVADGLAVIIDSSGQLGTTALGGGTGLTVANEGAGAQVYDTTTSTAGSAYLRSLTAGANVTITQNAGDITIAATGGGVAGGATGEVLTGTGGAPAWTGSPTLSGNLRLASSLTSTAGAIFKGGARFMHSFGGASTSVGTDAGNFTTSGISNTAIGYATLTVNATGANNTAVGTLALTANTDGGSNIAIGSRALEHNTTGSDNIAIGRFAATFVPVDANYNIHIGHKGIAADDATIRIGSGNQTRAFISGIMGGVIDSSNLPVYVDFSGQLGTPTSSRRYKDDIADMREASAELMKLRPVTFHYKADRNAAVRTLQYGLVAEEVNEIYPGLVARSPAGRIETVLYQFLAPMLLNEFQKQQRTIAAQATEMDRQTARIAELEQDRRAELARGAELERQRLAQVARIDALEQQASEMAMLKQQVALLVRSQQPGAALAQAAERGVSTDMSTPR